MKLALLVLVPVAILGGAAFAWHHWGDALAQGGNDRPRSSAVPSAAAPKVIRALGYVEPVSEIRRLVFKVDGVIDDCRVEVGEHVKAGQVLMTLKNEREAAALEVAQQTLAVAEAEKRLLLAGAHPQEIAAAVEAAALWQERYQFAQRRLTRIEKIKQTNAITEEERDQAETDVASALRNWQRAEAIVNNLKNKVRDEDRQLVESRVEQATAQVQLAEQQLDDTTLAAPFDGVVLDILKREGEGPRLLDREPVILFADTTRLQVRAEVDERFVAELEEGQAATIYGRGLGGVRYPAKVAHVKGLMGAKTVFAREADDRKDLDTIEVLIEAPPEFHPPVGLQVDVDIEIAEGRGD